MQDNFTTLFNEYMQLLSESSYTKLLNPPKEAILTKRAAKDLKKDLAMKSHYLKVMKDWEQHKHKVVWEKLLTKIPNDRFNIPRSVSMSSLALGGYNSYRAVGYIDGEHNFVICTVVPHEEYNKLMH